MIARLTIGQVDSGKAEGVAEAWRQGLSRFKEQGLHKAFIFSDRRTGKTVGVAIWESQEAMDAAEQGIAQVRQRITSEAGSTPPPTLEVYEVMGEI